MSEVFVIIGYREYIKTLVDRDQSLLLVYSPSTHTETSIYVHISRLDIQKFRKFIQLSHTAVQTPAAARGNRLSVVF